MDAATGAVAIAGLTVVGKPSVELVTDLIRRIVGPPADAVGNALAHPIIEWQQRRAHRGIEVVTAAVEMTAAAGKTPEAVPPPLFVSIVERASLEDDLDLQRRWASLLANAATNIEAIFPAFVSILGELSPVEARALDRLAQPYYEFIRRINDPTATPREILFRAMGQPRYVNVHDLETEGIIDISNFGVVWPNLVRLGLIAINRKQDDLTPNSVRGAGATLTAFGFHFVIACTPPEQEANR